ncbi:MAG: hypothetical protein DWQ01_12895 [Planctomycetota bacterium]|nr:MAG: hypothetical protein DWQ01_12895 [Planctomycetota bacterium]
MHPLAHHFTVLALGAGISLAMALVPPPEVQLPGSQPFEVLPLDPVEDCASCHANYDREAEPVGQWRGSMMAHSGRDPLFWAAMAVSEQTVDGAGDFCLRCHASGGWLAGRSSPTDGSQMLAAEDGNGVECDLCHRMTNPDNSEHLGIQNYPFIANDGGANPEGWYGSGMFVLSLFPDTKFGPYANTLAAHPSQSSNFHRESALCGTCHDVSNPFTGDLAPSHGAPVPLPPGQFSGVPGDPVTTKAALLNPPHRYGVVERTYSEHLAGGLDDWRVSDYSQLPPELQAGAIRQAWQSAQIAGRGGDYEDGTPRFFSCQSCHMRPVRGQGSNLPGSPLRFDLPSHDLTGGNSWSPQAILYLDQRDRLMLGGGLGHKERLAMQSGIDRARQNLRDAVRLKVDKNVVRIINLTGHKLLTGYPEGRRMWLNLQWFDAAGGLLREDGAYGDMDVIHRGQNLTVRSLLDLHDPRLHLYQAEMGIGQAWADRLIQLVGLPAQLPLQYDRTNGQVTMTLADAAAGAPGTAVESFHFVLNDTLLHDNRIPPFGFRYDEAEQRHCLPVPADQYGNPGPGGIYRHWDQVILDPPPGAARGRIRLLYQATCWEYVQFLDLANSGTIPHLAATGSDLLDAWLHTGMAEPEIMAEAEWQAPPWSIPPF